MSLLQHKSSNFHKIKNLLRSLEILLCLDDFFFPSENNEKKDNNSTNAIVMFTPKNRWIKITPFETQFQNITIVSLFSSEAYYISMLKSS